MKRLLPLYVCRLIYRGFKKTLTLEDIWDLPPQYKGRAVISRFQDILTAYTLAHRHKAETKKKLEAFA
jgi:hypothetical protein